MKKCEICNKSVETLIETWALNDCDEVDVCEECNKRLEDKRRARVE
ncbi:MAG: hypothetical protein GY909_16195 [Oligoflexia bacterium]|nr:hypothetical protein [Oligoflexia bacterium]